MGQFIAIPYGDRRAVILSRLQLVLPSDGGSLFVGPGLPLPPVRPVKLVILHLIIDFNVPLTLSYLRPRRNLMAKHYVINGQSRLQ